MEEHDGNTTITGINPQQQHHSNLNILNQAITSNITGNGARFTTAHQTDTNQQSLHSMMQAARSGINDFNAGIGSAPAQAYKHRSSSMHRFNVSLPALLQGSRCYTDASTMPDQVQSTPRKAGIGIFIINTQVQLVQHIYIKAAMIDSVSVLMAEVAALALAAVITDRLQLHHTNFLSDN
jgi:hypothetical protein